MSNGDLPGGAIAKRPLHFIFLVDCSGSMAVNGKMQALNHAINEAVPHMKKIAAANPKADMLIRCIRFSSGASWHQAQPTPIDKYNWTNLNSDGGSTDMAGAVRLATEALHKLPPGPYFPPVLCLISDGMPDNASELKNRLVDLKADNMGARAVRVAIGIGAEANSPAGKTALESFIGNIELQVLPANNAQDLVNAIRFVSTVVTESVSKPPSSGGDGKPTNAVVTPPPPSSSPPDPNLPW